MKKYLLYLISLIITILISISCDKSTDPTEDDIDIEMLIGNWMLTHEIYSEVEEWYENGQHGEDEWLDTTYFYDSSAFFEITQTALSAYHYDGNSPYYTKRITTPYQISGKQLTGHDNLNGDIDYGGGSYEKWNTTVTELDSFNLVVEVYYEYKEVIAPDWWLEELTIPQYFDKYSGTIPPSSWPDSVIITTDFNIRNLRVPSSKFKVRSWE